MTSSRQTNEYQVVKALRVPQKHIPSYTYISDLQGIKCCSIEINYISPIDVVDLKSKFAGVGLKVNVMRRKFSAVGMMHIYQRSISMFWHHVMNLINYLNSYRHIPRFLSENSICIWGGPDPYSKDHMEVHAKSIRRRYVPLSYICSIIQWRRNSAVWLRSIDGIF